jgi:putative transcriptional regulator
MICCKTCMGSSTAILLVMVKTPSTLPVPPFKRIRDQLGKSQTEMAKALGMTQANVWFYENRDQTVPPEVAKKLIAYAKKHGMKLTYNNIYEP